MSRVDVHPEELLDAARHGELSAADRERLDAHLAHCTACRVELEAMDDFVRELSPRGDDAARAASIVQRALAEAGLPDAGRASRPSHAPRAATTPTRRRTVAIAGAALAIGLFGGAAAAFWAATGGSWSQDDEGEAGGDRALDEPRATGATREASAEAVLDDTSAIEAPADESATEDAVDENAAEPPGTADTASAGETAADRAGRERPRPAVTQPTAEELLARANEARRARSYDEAERTYRTLQRLYPGSREAAVSRVTLGRLLLSSRGDAAGALAQFDHYLQAQPSGVLAEEARVGRAMSLERLGRTDDARAAWRELLASHPDSLHADRARRAIE